MDVRYLSVNGRRRVENCETADQSFPWFAALSRSPCSPVGRTASEPAFGRYRTINPIATALAMSMKKADTSGRMMKALAQAP
jgi:hypothetical protein